MPARIDHKVEPGECIGSIAYTNGFLPKTIWTHSRNAQLRSARKDRNVLHAGDVVHIPGYEPKHHSRGTDESHRFRRKGTKATFNVQFELDGEPRAELEFGAAIGPVMTSGTTDGQGWIRIPIRPDAKQVRITLYPGEDQIPENYVFELGNLEPVDTVTGQKARLSNLGYFFGEMDEESTPAFKRALRAFQSLHGLQVTGNADDGTQSKLKQEHKS